jgi:hypothetical protein
MSEPSADDVRKARFDTAVMDTATRERLAYFDGAVWPRPGAIIELGKPNRDAIVREVRLRVDGLITVYVDVLEGTIPPPEPRQYD